MSSGSSPPHIIGSTHEQKIEDDEQPQLSQSTLDALNQFLAEAQAASDSAQGDPFAENWALSQFWYTDATAAAVAEEAVEAAGPSGSIACIACPSLFRQLRMRHPDAQAHLLEIDERFEALGNFAYYDYREPTSLPEELRHAFTVVVADPPYLSAECLEKTVGTIKELAKPGEEATTHYLLTGATMREHARRLLGLRPTKFRPEHKNKLGNEFLLYTTSEAAAARLGGWDGDT